MQIEKGYHPERDEVQYRIELNEDEWCYLDVLLYEGRRHLVSSDPCDALVELFGAMFADESKRVDS